MNKVSMMCKNKSPLARLTADKRALQNINMNP